MMACAWLRSPVLACVLLSACGPFVIVDDDSDSEESAEVSDSGAVSTTGATSTTGTTSTTTAAPTTSPATTDEPSDPGYCAQACISTDDCAISGIDPADYPCIDGFCEYLGEVPPCDPATCDALLIGYCAQVDGVSVCATPCSDDSMCVTGFTQCTGTDDAGNPICEAVPCFGAAEGEGCVIDGFGQIGVCIEGECRCTDDSQCTGEGYACNG